MITLRKKSKAEEGVGLASWRQGRLVSTRGSWEASQRRGQLSQDPKEHTPLWDVPFGDCGHIQPSGREVNSWQKMAPGSIPAPPFLPTRDVSSCWILCGDTPLWSSEALMAAIMRIMGFGGGPSSLCEDPIVPTNCVEASRTTVCGVEAVGSREEYVIRASGHHWITLAEAEPMHLGYQGGWKGCGGLLMLEGGLGWTRVPWVLHHLCQLLEELWIFQSRRWRGNETMKVPSSWHPGSWQWLAQRECLPYSEASFVWSNFSLQTTYPHIFLTDAVLLEQVPLETPLLVNICFNGIDFFFWNDLISAGTFISMYRLAFKNSSDVFTCLGDLVLFLFPTATPHWNQCSCLHWKPSCQALVFLLLGTSEVL